MLNHAVSVQVRYRTSMGGRWFISFLRLVVWHSSNFSTICCYNNMYTLHPPPPPPPFLFFSPFRTNSLNSTTLPSYLLSTFFYPHLCYTTVLSLTFLNYIQHGSCKLLVISLRMPPQMLITSRNLETWRSQKECQKGFPVHLDGCWYVPSMAPFFPSLSL